MKKRMRKFYKEVAAELRENRTSFLVYAGLRLLVIGIMILQIFNGNFENVFLCLLTLVLLIMPSVVQVTFHVEFPTPLEIVIFIFIFAAEILGELSAFYQRFPHWDAILHSINGFLCAAIGFALVDIMNRQKKLTFSLSPMFLAITAFCFSMTIGVLWEFFEFAMDTLFKLDMQKDTVVTAIHSTLLDPTKSNTCVHITGIESVAVNGNELNVAGYLDIGLVDTMWDMFVNFVGAAVFSVMGYFYVKYRDGKSAIVKKLVPEPWSEEKLAARLEARAADEDTKEELTES